MLDDRHRAGAARLALLYPGTRGGGAWYAFELANALASRSPLRAVVHRGVSNADAWAASGFDVLFSRTLGSRAEPLSYLGLCREATRRADVAVFPMIHPLVPVLLAQTPKSARRILVVHDPTRHPGDPRWPDVVQGIAVRLSSGLIVLTSVAAQAVAERYGIGQDRIQVIPHPVLFASMPTRPIEDLRRVVHDRPALVFVGRIRRYKGLGLLNRAWRMVRDRDPDPVLIIGGQGDPSLLEPFLGDDRVFIVNRWLDDEELQWLVAKATVVLLPYTEASQSGVAAVAVRQGLPIVATTIGGLVPQLSGYANAVFAEPTPEAVAEAIQDAVKRPRVAHPPGDRPFEDAVDRLERLLSAGWPG